MKHLTPLRDHVIVKNLDFGSQVTRGGIILLDDDGSERGIHPRWAEVWRVGEGVHDLKVGDWVLLEHGRWSRTSKLKVDDEMISINRIDYPKGVLLRGDHKGEDVFTATTKTTQR